MTLTSSTDIAFSRPVFLVRFVIPRAIKTNSTRSTVSRPEYQRLSFRRSPSFRMTLAGSVALLGLTRRDILIHRLSAADLRRAFLLLVHFYGARICSIGA